MYTESQRRYPYAACADYTRERIMSGQPDTVPTDMAANSRPVTQPTLLDVPQPSMRRCGLDEVGRGALAGPLVAAAVILPDDIAERLGPLVRFLRDSKTVPPTRRR